MFCFIVENQKIMIAQVLLVKSYSGLTSLFTFSKCYRCSDKKKHIWAGIIKEDLKEETVLVFSMDREVFCGRREFLKKGVKTACGRLGRESPLKALYNYTINGWTWINLYSRTAISHPFLKHAQTENQKDQTEWRPH